MDRRHFFQSTSWFILSLSGAKLLASCSPSSTTSETQPTSETPQAETVTATTTQIKPLSEIKELNFGIISTESQANQKPFGSRLFKRCLKNSECLLMPSMRPPIMG